MDFKQLKNLIKISAQKPDFQTESKKFENLIFDLPKNDFVPLITEIGSIPEDIEHDSSEEKLFTKVSDIILAKSLIELGLQANVNKARANCADVIAKSKYHNYSLVADAKSFRLSRTAKNQKDFKIKSMVDWKCDNDYSVLCCPYFQYPKIKSQIYGQAIQGNVTLFSWEYLTFLLTENVKETPELSLEPLWNFSKNLEITTTVQNMNNCFLDKQNDFIKNILNYHDEQFNIFLSKAQNNIIKRGEAEICYWHKKQEEIRNYSHEKAVRELIQALKLNEKIISITNFINQLRGKNGIR